MVPPSSWITIIIEKTKNKFNFVLNEKTGSGFTIGFSFLYFKCQDLASTILQAVS